MNEQKIMVNCALPYANGPLHLGHLAGAYLGADIFVRFSRLSGTEVMFISGSDEYGTPITITAEKNNKRPQEIADKYHSEHMETFRNVDIIFDKFTRTTDAEHVKDVDEFFMNLLEKGFLEKRYMVSPYCRKSNRFMPDRYIEGTCPYCGYKEARGDQCDNCGRTLDPIELIDPVCKIGGERPEFRETEHYFLMLNKLQDSLLEYLGTKDFWKPNVLKYTKNFVSDGLKPRAITRDLDWGVPIPINGYEHKKIYVWFEALIGYITGAREYSTEIGNPEYWKSFWLDKNIKSYYFIGKDNIPFHTIIWPAMLIAHGDYNLPYNVPANEYLRFQGEQFSKSRGIGFTVNEILKIADKNSLRYYMASILPETGDSDFSMREFQDKVNSELVDKFGNYIYRLISFIDKNKLSIHKPEKLSGENKKILDMFKEKFDQYSQEVSEIHIKRGLQIWLELVISANQYFNNAQPWKIIKENKEECNDILYTSLKIAQYLILMIYPYVPTGASEVWSMINNTVKIEGSTFEKLLSIDEFAIKKQNPPFTKLDFGEVINN